LCFGMFTFVKSTEIFKYAEFWPWLADRFRQRANQGLERCGFLSGLFKKNRVNCRW